MSICVLVFYGIPVSRHNLNLNIDIGMHKISSYQYNTMASEDAQYWGAEGILCIVMKLRNPIFAKAREYGNMLSQEHLEF